MIKFASNEKNLTDITLAQLALGTIPIILAFFILNSFIDSTRSLDWIAIFLATGSLLMLLAENFYKNFKDYPKNKVISRSETILIGLFQSLAIFPGMSRSGSTISGALLLGRGRSEAVRFSFLLAIPSLILAGIKEVLELSLELFSGGVNLLPNPSNLAGEQVNLSILAIFFGFVASYISGLLTLKWLLKYLSNHSFKVFIYYRLILALVIFILLFTNFNIGFSI